MKVQNKSVIRVLSVEHGAQVIQWFKNQGVATLNFLGEAVGHYYGLNENGNFDHWRKLFDGYTEIMLPELPKRGDKVLVWDYHENSAVEKIFLAYIEEMSNPVICVTRDDEENFLNNKKVSACHWKHYKLIEPIVEVELTLDEIAAKFGINVSQLKIKK